MRRGFVVASVVVVVVAATTLLYFGAWRIRSSQVGSSTDSLPEPIPSIQKDNLPSTNPDIFYPMTEYQARITNRDYGQPITPANREGLPCGQPFQGFHTADDLEVRSSEIDQEVPVFAIAAGTIRQARAIDGYGGLIVVEHQLSGQMVTAYYGHVDLSQATAAVGEIVTAGQRLSFLGDHCSRETSNERKHLHFSIRLGSEIDIRGYVGTEAELRNWIDPKAKLEELNASVPPA